MPSPEPKFCLSRAEAAHFEPMHGYRGWVKMYYEGEGEFVLKAGDFFYHPPKRVHDFMEYSDDIEVFELASPANHSATDV